jgi:FKBP-type peptidyl-prolyl cis-trans isomerase FkpA
MKRLLIGLCVACALGTGLGVLAATQAPPASPAPAAQPATPSPSPRVALPPGVPPRMPGAPPAPPPAPPKPEDEPKILYAIGFVLGGQTSVFALTPAEAEQVKKGFADAVAAKEAEIAMDTFGPQIRPFAQVRQVKKTEMEKEKGRAFAEQAAKEPGAVKADSGLVYIEQSKGTGAMPKPTDKIKVHYHGTFPDGKVFDTTKGRDPAELSVNGVIPCWTEGLQKMAVGGKARLVCPSSIAYGDAGRPGIAGGSTLVFDLELLEVVPPAAAASPAPAAPVASPAASPAAPKPPAAPAPSPKASPAP